MSVVVPVRDGGEAFRRCLRALRECPGAEFELIVVDDGSRDDSARWAERAGAIVLRNDRPKGPAAARNTGARAASSPIVFFLDADVAVHRDAITRVLDLFRADSGLAAVFGSYDDAPASPGLVSTFRNLLHHYVHQRGRFVGGVRPAHTFWTGCGAIRRDVFLEAGGFDPQRYRRPAIEDIEFGYRLTRAGHRIALARDLRVTHLKHWTLRDVVRTDIFRRGVPWTVLMLRSRVAESDLNVSASQRASVALTGLSTIAALSAPWVPALSLLAATGAAAAVALNARFYRFLMRTLGPRKAAACVPLHGLYFACCGISVAIGLAIWLVQPRSRRPIADRAPLAPRPDGPSGVAPSPHLGSSTRPPNPRSPARWNRFARRR